MTKYDLFCDLGPVPVKRVTTSACKSWRGRLTIKRLPWIVFLCLWILKIEHKWHFSQIFLASVCSFLQKKYLLNILCRSPWERWKSEVFSCKCSKNLAASVYGNTICNLREGCLHTRRSKPLNSAKPAGCWPSSRASMWPAQNLSFFCSTLIEVSGRFLNSELTRSRNLRAGCFSSLFKFLISYFDIRVGPLGDTLIGLV